MLSASEAEPLLKSTLSEGRLIIEKIVVENFKSYAGKQEIGPFHKVVLLQFEYPKFAS